MKKNYLFLIQLIILLGSTQILHAQASCPEPWTKCMIEASPSPNYICHQYIRGALENNWVNLYTGERKESSTLFSNLPSGEILSDNKYVFISNTNAYEVVAFNNGHGVGHSALKLKNSPLYAAKWNSDPLYWVKNPGYYFSDTLLNPRYMVYIGIPTPVGQVNMNPGQQQDFFVKQVSGLCYSWSFNANYFTMVSGSTTSNTIRLQAKCPTQPVWNSSQTVTVIVGCSDVGQKTYNFPVSINTTGCSCLGTYTVYGSSTTYQLNTVNNVSNSPIVTTLNSGPGVIYAWTLTSGAPSSWYYYGTGNRNLSVSLNKGSSASFRFTSSECNRNITFYRGSTLMAAKSLDNLADSTITSSDTLIIPSDVIINYEKANQPETGQCNAVWVNQNTKKLIVKDNIEGVRSYKIISVQGILRKSGKVLSGNTEIDIQDIPSGIYIISIADCNYRFIKQ